MNMLLFMGFALVMMSGMNNNIFYGLVGLLCVVSSVGLSMIEIMEPRLAASVRNRIYEKITKQDEYERLK